MPTAGASCPPLTTFQMLKKEQSCPPSTCLSPVWTFPQPLFIGLCFRRIKLPGGFLFKPTKMFILFFSSFQKGFVPHRLENQVTRFQCVVWIHSLNNGSIIDWLQPVFPWVKNGGRGPLWLAERLYFKEYNLFKLKLCRIGAIIRRGFGWDWTKSPWLDPTQLLNNNNCLFI